MIVVIDVFNLFNIDLQTKLKVEIICSDIKIFSASVETYKKVEKDRNI